MKLLREAQAASFADVAVGWGAIFYFPADVKVALGVLKVPNML